MGEGARGGVNSHRGRDRRWLPLVEDTTRNRLNRKSDLPLGQIGVARDAYNGVVREYNTAITTFPAVLMARSMGFTPRGFFEAQAESREVPSVQLR